MFVTDDAQAVVEPIYEAQILDELRRIVDGIPHDSLAIQWDVCIEMWMWEGWLPSPFSDVQREILVRLGRLGDAVPAGAELGYHLCYGDYEHEHFHEPADTANLAAIGNGIVDAVQRSIEWIHIPVPIERDDVEYFAALRALTIDERTELYLGLVHARDGVDGARRRIAAARSAGIEQFGVATECGMGRRPPDRGGSDAGLRELLQTHAAVSRPVAVTP
jgi:methionine synthase II (cobalamin-independent)